MIGLGTDHGISGPMRHSMAQLHSTHDNTYTDILTFETESAQWANSLKIACVGMSTKHDTNTNTPIQKIQKE